MRGRGTACGIHADPPTGRQRSWWLDCGQGSHRARGGRRRTRVVCWVGVRRGEEVGSVFCVHVVGEIRSWADTRMNTLAKVEKERPEGRRKQGGVRAETKRGTRREVVSGSPSCIVGHLLDRLQRADTTSARYHRAWAWDRRWMTGPACRVLCPTNQTRARSSLSCRVSGLNPGSPARLASEDSGICSDCGVSLLSDCVQLSTEDVA